MITGGQTLTLNKRSSSLTATDLALPIGRGSVWICIAALLMCPLVSAALPHREFVPVGSMSTARTSVPLVTLCDGRVLAVGGDGAAGELASAELYNPVSRTWSLTGSMSVARSRHTATLLPDCSVLVAGGAGLGARGTAERFFPASGTWAMTGSLNEGRFLHIAIRLGTGKVLVAGGVAPAFTSNGTNSAELYDPATGSWSVTDSMTHGRWGHAATNLSVSIGYGGPGFGGEGRILVAGGSAQGGAAGASAATAEVYDAATGIWSDVGSMAVGRWQDFTLTTLPNLTAVVIGGVTDWTLRTTNVVEVFNPTTGVWTPAEAMPETRFGHTTTVLQRGNLLVAGGNDHPMDFGPGTTLRTASTFFNGSLNFLPTRGPMVTARQLHGAAALQDGSVLVAGGHNVSQGVLASAELFGAYDPDLVAAYSFDNPLLSPLDEGPNMVPTFIDGPTAVSGRFGNAFHFDGIDDVVTTLPAGFFLGLSTGMTIEAWVRTEVHGGWRTVAIGERPGGLSYALYSSKPGDHRPGGYAHVNGIDAAALGTGPIPINEWNHLATTFDGSRVRLYVNGVLVRSTPAAGVLNPTAEVFRIGGSSTWGEFFRGDIDEVLLYRRALTASEIQKDMQRPIETFDNPEPTSSAGLAAAYSFDEGTGTQLSDLSGNNNHGNVDGAEWVAGVNGMALRFDGMNDLVRVPDAPSLDATTGLTIEAMVRPSENGGFRSVVLKERAQGLVYSLYADDPVPGPSAFVRIGGVDRDVQSTTGPLPIGEWTHLVATYGNGALTLYADGVPIGTLARTGQIAVSNGQLTIGGNSIWGEFFAGEIDNLRIYTRRLTIVEVQNNRLVPVQ